MPRPRPPQRLPADSFMALQQYTSEKGLKKKDLRVKYPPDAELASDGAGGSVRVWPASVWNGKCTELFHLSSYWVSEDARVWKKAAGGAFRTMSTSAKGRVGVTLRGSLSRMFFVHRIVASTFLSNVRLPGQNEVDHINKRKGENPHALFNLRWATGKQNMATSDRTRSKSQVSIATSVRVKSTDPLTGAIAEYPSAHEAARQTKASNSNIIQCCKGTSLTAGGLMWAYVVPPRAPPVTVAELNVVLTETGRALPGEKWFGPLEDSQYLFLSDNKRIWRKDRLSQAGSTQGGYPVIRIAGKLVTIHRAYIAMTDDRFGSLAALDAHCAKHGLVVLHEDDRDKTDWVLTRLGTPSENLKEAHDNGCYDNGRTRRIPLAICTSPRAASSVLQWPDGTLARYGSSHEALRDLKRRGVEGGHQGSMSTSLKSAHGEGTHYRAGELRGGGLTGPVRVWCVPASLSE